MNRTLRLVALPLVAATSLAGTSCVDNTQSVYISGFLAITEKLTCAVSADQTDFATGGVADTELMRHVQSPGYLAAPLLHNNMVATASMNTPERNNIIPKALEVELHASPGKSLPPTPGLGMKFSTSFAYPAVEPGGVGFGQLVLVPRDVLVAAANNLGDPNWDGVLVATVRFAFEHNGGLEYTATRDFPIEVAPGALGNATQACPVGGFETNQIQKACLPGQDVPVTCCTQGGFLYCGDTAPVKSTTGDGGI